MADKINNPDDRKVRQVSTGLNIILDGLNRNENELARGTGEALWEVFNDLGTDEFEGWLGKQDDDIQDNFDHYMFMARFAREYPKEFRKFIRLGREKMEILTRLPDLYVRQLGTGEEDLASLQLLELEMVLDSLPASRRDRRAMLKQVVEVRTPALRDELNFWKAADRRSRLRGDAISRIRAELKWLVKKIAELKK